MAGTRTAGTVDGTGSFKEVSVRWIDAVGDIRSDATIVDAAATDAQIEAVVAALQAGSNASIYAVRVTEVYEGAKSKSNAVAGVRESVQDNIVYHAKDTGRVDRRSFLPSPLAAVFVADTETPDEGDALVVTLMAAWDTVWAGTFAGVSLRFTERREINEKVQL
jgi:hypothetical protein